MTQQTVFVVDDEEGQRQSLRWLLESNQHRVETYDGAEAFLERFDETRPGCLLLDVRLGGVSGPELMDLLLQRQVTLPVIFLSGHGDVQVAVRAMKAGAIDFIEKPYDRGLLLGAVQRALRADTVERERRAQENAFRACLTSLTPREREIFGLITTGRSNRLIGDALGISCRTVEAHRAKLMRKMRATSLAELLQRAANFNLGVAGEIEIAAQYPA